MYVVVVQYESQETEVFGGPWTDKDEAERARRRIHFDARMRNHSIRGPYSHVKKIMPEEK